MNERTNDRTNERMSEFRFEIAPIKQLHAGKPHLQFHVAQSNVNLVRCHQARLTC
jgi:hypothetical protein